MTDREQLIRQDSGVTAVSHPPEALLQRQLSAANRNPGIDPAFDYDFATMPVHAPANEAAPEPVPPPFGPNPNAKPLPPVPGPTAIPGVADLYISVYSPATITPASIMTTKPLDGPSSGLSFQLSQHAKFKQDEYIIGRLTWKPAGSKTPDRDQEEEYSRFVHNWDSVTQDRPDLPGNPIMLKDSDHHGYGLSKRPGSVCEAQARKHRGGYDRNRNDWSFTESGMFIDTVTFKDREIKRKYFFDFRAQKEGSRISASLHYGNVDKVELV